MANIVQLKRSSVSGRTPDAANISVGEPVINLADKIIYTKDAGSNVIIIGAGTTSNVAEGNNLYFTNARALSAVTNATVQGNLTVTGNVTAGTLTANTVIYSTGTGGSITGANLISATYIQGNVWNGLYTANVAESNGNLYYTDARVYSNVSSIGFATASNIALKANVADLTTANVTERTNLYYTNARVYANVLTLGYATNSNVSLKANISDLTTGNIVDDLDLFFSNEKVYANVVAIGYTTGLSIAAKANIADLTTANVAEVTNLYFTNARSIAALTAGTNITIDANGRITSTATGGGGGGGSSVTVSNTEPAVATTGGFWLDQDDGIIYISVDGIWQEFARTLKGYATPNYVDNQEYTTLKLAYGLEDLANVGIWNPTNDDLLTYHNGAWISKPFSVVTGNIAESTNLYFTNARARAAVTGTTGLSYDSSTGVFGFDPLASVQFNNVTLSGNLIVQGTTTTVNTRNFTVSDNMLYLNEATSLAVVNAVGDGVNVTYTVSTTHDFEVGDYARITGITPSGYNSGWTDVIAITSNTLTIANTYTGSYVSGGTVYVKAAINPDLGIAGGYNDGTYHHSGVFRDASDGNWKFFHKYTPEPDNDTFIDTSHASFELANVQAQLFIGNVTGTVSSISNHTTDNLSEGTTNRYFSNTRVNNYLTDTNKLIPSGTKMLFVQTSAPTGWTKDTTHNDKALRVVSGSASFSGNVAFSTVFASRTPTGTVGSTTLTAAQSGMPAHSHGVSDPGHSHTASMRTTDSGTINNFDAATTAGTVGTLSVSSSTTGISINNATAVDASSGHTHTWTGDAMDFDLNYVDVIIATKD